MFSLSATTSLRIRRLTSLIVAALAIAALLAMVAPAARMPSNESDNWGAAATFAKQQTRTTAARDGKADPRAVRLGRSRHIREAARLDTARTQRR